MPTKQINADLQEVHFRAWLTGHDDDAVVGKSHSSCDCPIARYLQQVPYTRVVVTDIRIRCGASYVAPPLWCSWFIGRVDALEEWGTSITKTMAVQILDTMAKERQ